MSTAVESDTARKRVATLKALAALRGFAVHELTVGGFMVARWNLAKHCATVTDLEAFLRQAGVEVAAS